MTVVDLNIPNISSIPKILNKLVFHRNKLKSTVCVGKVKKRKQIGFYLTQEF